MFKLIGHGESGKVYQTDQSTIKKVYNNKNIFLKERQILQILSTYNIQSTAIMLT